MWILRSGEDEDRLTFRLMPGAVKTLGRAKRADFVLDAALVSRLHCRLTAGPAGELEIEDLESTNGTWVNDRRITRKALSSGDRVRIGRIELRVEKNGSAPTRES